MLDRSPTSSPLEFCTRSIFQEFLIPEPPTCTHACVTGGKTEDEEPIDHSLITVTLFQAIRNSFVSTGFERRQVIFGYCDKITRPAAFALESVHVASPYSGERHRKRKCSTIFLERTRKGHRQSNQHWNCSKGNLRETPERRGATHMGLPERIDTILN